MTAGNANDLADNPRLIAFQARGVAVGVRPQMVLYNGTLHQRSERVVRGDVAPNFMVAPYDTKFLLQRLEGISTAGG